MTPLPALACLAACLGSLAGCGTAVYEHRVRVLLLEPPARCGLPPWEMLAFETYGGYSGDAEWARQQLGPTSPAEPYVVPVSSMEARWMGDSTPAKSVPVGLYVPCVRTDGYWSVDVAPDAASPTTIDARFCPWGTLNPQADALTVPVTAVATRGKKRAWDLTLQVNLSSTEDDAPPAETPPEP